MRYAASYSVVLTVFVGVVPGMADGGELLASVVPGEVLQTYTGPGSSRFGSSLADLGEDWILVGASDVRVHGINQVGAAFLYNVDTAALLRTFNNPTPGRGDRFGVSAAALDARRFVIGARGDDDQVGSSGIAYLYDADTGGLLTTFHNPRASQYDEFGESVATLGDDRVLMGAYREDAKGYDAGAAYLFDAESGDLLQSFFSPNPHGEDHFGTVVAGVGDDRVIVSSHRDDTRAHDAGAAYLFDAQTGKQLRAFYHPTPEDSDYFGIAIAPVGSDKVLIGARGDDTGAANTGAAFLFDVNSGQLLHTFLNPTPAENDVFGYHAEAISERLIVIGADADDTGARDAGSAYLFDLLSGDLLATINNPSPAQNDHFGFTFAGVGDAVVVGSVYNRNVYLLAVPEPGSLVLLCTGTFLLGFTRRGRNRQSAIRERQTLFRPNRTFAMYETSGSKATSAQGTICAGLVCLVGLFTADQAHAAAPEYDLISLGSLGSGTLNRAEAINNAGRVVGGSADKAFLWTPETGMQALPGLGGSSWWAEDINDDGVIVGNVWHSALSGVPVRWVNGAVEQLSSRSGSAKAINDTGLIGGFVGSSSPFLYDMQLTIIDGNTDANILDINDNGDAVGFIDRWTPVVWENRVRRILPASGSMRADAINNAGWIGGHGSDGPVLWRDDETIPLAPHLPGFEAVVKGINESGQIVGWVPAGWYPQEFTFLWEDGNLIDLQQLLLPEDAGWELVEINDINEAGQMVGIAYDPTGRDQAILLNPVPEPASLVLMGFGVLMSFGLIRHWKPRVRARRLLRSCSRSAN